MWLTGVALAGSATVLHHARLPGGEPGDLWIRDGKFVDPPSGAGGAGAVEVDLGGAWIVPGVIDSHVHLAYDPVGPAIADRGIAAAVDLAAPEKAIGVAIPSGPRVRWSGPMITAPNGYPTTSWGRDGYGIQCATADQAEAAVRRLVKEGATVIKVPIQAPVLSDDALKRTIATAHALGVPVAVHALDDAGAAKAAALGADVLAHTPVQPLSASTVQAWSGKTVISTLVAFGGSADAVANLEALRAAGAKVLYGTDLGNDQTVGVDRDELALLQRAGLDGAAILAAMTSDPAGVWGWSDLGSIAPGKAASFLVLDRDPLVEPLALASPKQVWIDGVRRGK